MQTRRQARRAFTLIEVMLVIVILVSLASVAVVVLWPAREEANAKTTKLKIEKVMSGLERYANEMGYPSEEQALKALLEKPQFEDAAMADKWHGPYVSPTDLKDAWGKDLVYKIEEVQTDSTTRKVPRVHSLGQNQTDDDGSGDDICDDAWQAAKAAQNQ